MNSQNVAVPLLRVEGRPPQPTPEKHPLLFGQPSFSRAFADGESGVSVAAVMGAAFGRAVGHDVWSPSGQFIHLGHQLGQPSGPNSGEAWVDPIEGLDSDVSVTPVKCGSGCEFEHPEMGQAEEPSADLPQTSLPPRSCGSEHAFASTRPEGKPAVEDTTATSWSNVEVAEHFETVPGSAVGPNTPISGETVPETAEQAPAQTGGLYSVFGTAAQTENHPGGRPTSDQPEEGAPTPGTAKPAFDGPRAWILKDRPGGKGNPHDKQVIPAAMIPAPSFANGAVSTEPPAMQPSVEQTVAPHGPDLPAVARNDDALAQGRPFIDARPVNLVPAARVLSGGEGAPDADAGFGANRPQESVPEPELPARPEATPQMLRRDWASEYPTAANAMNPLLSISDRAFDSHDEPLFPSVPDFQGPSASRHSTMHVAPTHASGGAEMARQVASQIAVAAQADGSTEIALDPEELGRVRLRLTGTETTMSVLIIAERPETAELMRRHVDALAQEFRDIGYADLQFQFESGTNDQHETGEGESTASSPVQDELRAEPVPQVPVPTGRSDGTSGLDLRL